MPYVFADPDLVASWRQELSTLKGFKVGIAWQGSPRNINDRQRSMPLQCFAPLARLPDVYLISLQKGPGEEQLRAVPPEWHIIDFAHRLDESAGPFMDTAAVILNLDLVISCDSVVGHLAGALGAPVWLALPAPADWRWLLAREDSPWYPTMRLFRQRQRGNWDDVFKRLATALAEEMRQPSKLSTLQEGARRV